MKKIYLFIVSAFLIQASIYSQPCLPEGITFSTQAQIDSFAINYPNCTNIEGDVYIGEWDDDGSDITNLNGLSVLTSIDGSLIIGSAFEDVFSNPYLTSLEGLTNLSYIGGYLTLIANTSLGSLAGLESLTSIEGSLVIAGNDSLTSLTGLDNVTSIEGDLKIGSQFGSAMGSYILGNPSLASLTGLEGLSTIGGNLQIGKNDTLTSLTGLEGLTSIGGNLEIGFETGDISFSGNPSLTSLAVLSNLTSLGGGLRIRDNSVLADLQGLNNLDSIEDFLVIMGNSSLTNLTGLENITSVGGSLGIGSSFSINSALTNLVGLEELNFVGGDLYILYNPALTNLTGLDNVSSIGGYVSIIGNSSLTSLMGLNSVASIEGSLYILENDALTNLAGLENIDENSITVLWIIHNSSLSTCEVQSICDYLASPNGDVEIYDNALGCDSQQEVEDACEALDLNEVKFENEFLLYPNPATNEIYIKCNNGVKIVEVIIYNTIGQIVLQEKLLSDKIDISRVNHGLYFIELVSNGMNIRKKLIVN